VVKSVRAESNPQKKTSNEVTRVVGNAWALARNRYRLRQRLRTTLSATMTNGLARGQHGWSRKAFPRKGLGTRVCPQRVAKVRQQTGSDQNVKLMRTLQHRGTELPRETEGIDQCVLSSSTCKGKNQLRSSHICMEIENHSLSIAAFSPK
jgi:hypothetical protein